MKLDKNTSNKPIEVSAWLNQRGSSPVPRQHGMKATPIQRISANSLSSGTK